MNFIVHLESCNYAFRIATAETPQPLFQCFNHPPRPPCPTRCVILIAFEELSHCSWNLFSDHSQYTRTQTGWGHSLGFERVRSVGGLRQQILPTTPLSVSTNVLTGERASPSTINFILFMMGRKLIIVRSARSPASAEAGESS